MYVVLNVCVLWDTDYHQDATIALKCNLHFYCDITFLHAIIIISSGSGAKCMSD